MKLTAKLIATSKNEAGRSVSESFAFTEHQGMLNVTYSRIGGGAEPTFLCYRFNDRRQGNALYIALKRLGAVPYTAEELDRAEDRTLSVVRRTMRQGVSHFDELLASLIISGYVQAA